MLKATEDTLKQRSAAFAERLGSSAELITLKSLVGGGSAPEVEFNSWGVRLNLPGISAIDVEARLRQSKPPVIARIEDDRVVLDFRTILPGEEDLIFAAVRQALER
jgi:L-seryl-tRNA(Ser) seleniumtransferase